ncbi:Myosin-10 [Zea mays]|uniref:Myosin-10 n=1 Tax=Zea mays TaxID=4577 RepID=A0A1D6HDR8_MAIZE|nr:Myosin-10 [Zea mays]
MTTHTAEELATQIEQQKLEEQKTEEKHNEQFLESQTRWRQHRAYAAYKQQQKASLILQCLWRARIARKELRKLRMEARETGALKEAKDKLEKRVEELTWRLDVEKRLRADLEEAKSHEIEKLQSALQKMQENLKEAHAAIVNEKEAAKLAIEQAPPKIVEVPVIDNAKLEELTTQNKELEEELSTFKQKAEDLENKLIEFQKQSDELSQETQEQASKVIQLQELVERLESKIATLESEIELLHNNSALAIQAVVTPEMNQTTIIEEFDKGHQLEEVKTVNEARETGALKEAKDKLEKRVEELTWRLDVEKRLRADLEEAKSHEIEKLQSALQKMQENLKEAHAAIVNEKEAAKLAIEQAPPKIVEVPVIDNAKLEELTTQNKELEETQEQASKVIQLQELVERLESKIATLESEIELLHNNSALAIQAVVTPEMNQTTIIEEFDKGHQLEEVKTVNEQVVVPPVKNLSKQKSQQIQED